VFVLFLAFGVVGISILMGFLSLTADLLDPIFLLLLKDVPIKAGSVIDLFEDVLKDVIIRSQSISYEFEENMCM
jgi:hypothetical protein